MTNLICDGDGLTINEKLLIQATKKCCMEVSENGEIIAISRNYHREKHDSPANPLKVLGKLTLRGFETQTSHGFWFQLLPGLLNWHNARQLCIVLTITQSVAEVKKMKHSPIRGFSINRATPIAGL